MRTSKQSIFFSILAIITLVFTFGCSGKNLNGTWEAKVRRLTFSGKNFTSTIFFPTVLDINMSPIEAKGTYSLSGDKIEFLYSDGSVEVSSFSRTKNTIMVGNDLYISIDPKLKEQQAESQKEQQKERQNEYHIIILRTLANIMGGFENLPSEQRRETFDFILQNILVNENSMVQVYSIWKPYALDGMDANFIGRVGSTPTGQYAIKCSRESGEITIGTRTVSEVDSSMSWFNGPQARTDQIGDPMQKNIKGQNTFVIETIVPIINPRTNEVIGGIGCIFIDNTQ